MSDISKTDLPPGFIEFVEEVKKGFEENKKRQEAYSKPNSERCGEYKIEELSELVEVGKEKENTLRNAGYDNVDDLEGVTIEELEQLDGIGHAGASLIEYQVNGDGYHD